MGTESYGEVMNNIPKLLLVFLLPYFVIGCSSTPVIDDLKYPMGQVSLYGESEKESFYENEVTKGANYEIGISLSGGGVRSASFSVGALAGLNDSGILQRADAISTVSGGGYAGYWLLSYLYHSDKARHEISLDELFYDCYPDVFPLYKGTKNYFYPSCGDPVDRLNSKYRFQNQIAQQSDLLYYYQDGSKYGKTLQISESIFKVLYHVGSLIPHHVGNTLFDWGWNVSGSENTYRNGIERTFGLVPVDLHGGIDQKKYLNSKKLLHLDNGRATPLEFKELSAYISRNWSECSIDNRNKGACVRAPLWIINSTAGVANKVYSWVDDVPPLSQTVFEMTPFGYGSGEYGYVSQPFSQFGVSKAIAVSGAAADNQFESGDLTGFKRAGLAMGIHLLNAGLGESISNYNPERSSYTLHAFLPWPLYYLHGFTRDRDSTDIYLSDGGHSENLGAYSLITRGVKNVIIVDSEHDENGSFQALRRLQERLEKEHRLFLKFDSLPDKIDSQDAPENIYVGKVTGYRDGYVSGDGSVNVIYIKSAVVKSLMSPDCSSDDGLYPCSTYLHYSHFNLRKNEDNTCQLSGHNNLFPHHSTSGTAMDMSQDIYFSYRDFARFITKRLYLENGLVMVREMRDLNIPVSPVECPNKIELAKTTNSIRDLVKS
jgi:patatin-like phospholipase